MIFFAGILLHALLAATPQNASVTFRITDAYVSYEAHETHLGSSLETIRGRNNDLVLDLVPSRGNLQAKLLISGSGFKTDRPMRDWSVRTLYLKSSQYPEITFELLKIDGVPVASVLQPLQQTEPLKTSLQNVTVSMTVPDRDNAPMVIQVGQDKFLADGQLRKDILNALHSDTGEIHVTGRLTVTAGSKDFDTAVSFVRTGASTFSLSTVIPAAFTDFGMTAPSLSWFIEVHNDLILRGHAVLEVLQP